jgi:hypothetical protein
VATALLVANNKDFLIWRGTQHYPVGVWKYTASTGKYTLFADELFDGDTSTSMPLTTMLLSDFVYVLTEMPPDKISPVIGSANAQTSWLMVDYWNGVWKLLRAASAWSNDTYYDSQCTSLTGWDDDDAGDAVTSQETFKARECFKLDNGSSGGANDAGISKDMGTFSDSVSLSVLCYHDNLGTTANGDRFAIVINESGVNMSCQIGTDGLYIHDGASYNEVGTDIVKQKEWVLWTFVCDFSTPASATVDVYKNGTLVEASVDCSNTGSFTDGDIVFWQFGDTTANRITYIAEIVVGDGLDTTGDGFSDGTVSSGTTLAQSGDISWTAPSDYVKTDVEGVPGYAVRFAPNVTTKTVLSATDYLDHECDSLSGWTDGDAGANAESTATTFDTKSVWKFDSGDVGGTAARNKDLGTFVDIVTVSMSLYHEDIGTHADTDTFDLYLQESAVSATIEWASDGMFVYDGSSWNEVGTNIVDTDTWTEWTFYFDFSTPASSFVDIYKDGEPVAYGVDCSNTGARTDGEFRFRNRGTTTANQITYVDWVNCGDSLTDQGTVTITGLTVHTPIASVKNIWDGMHEPPTGCYVYDGTDHTDYMAYVNNIIESQYMDLSGVTTTDKIYVGFVQRVNKIIFYPAADGKNTNDVSVTAVKYHNASGTATSVGTVTDTTETSTKMFSQKGYMSWADPGWQNEKMTTIGGDDTPMYWYEITVDAALVDPTYIYYIRGVPLPKDPDPSYGVFAYKRRAWQIAPRNKENMVRYSAANLPNVWNGSDSGYIAFGERPLKAAGAFYNETVLYADTEMWMLQGNKPANFGRLRLSGKVGISSAQSLVEVESGVVVSDVVKVVLCWFFFDGIWMFDGVRIWKISAPDIDSFFDPDHTDYINPAKLGETTGEYDYATQTVRWAVYSGSAATTPTKVLVMHFPTLNFGIFDYGTDIDAMLSVVNNKYYLVGGGHSDGRFYQLDSGTTDLVAGTATAVDAYVITRDEFLSYSDGLRQRLNSVWMEAQSGGGQLELDEYPDGSKTPQNIAKKNMTFVGKIFGALQRTLKFYPGQKTTKFRIRNRSKNARMKLLGYSTTVDKGRADE